MMMPFRLSSLQPANYSIDSWKEKNQNRTIVRILNRIVLIKVMN